MAFVHSLVRAEINNSAGGARRPNWANPRRITSVLLCRSMRMETSSRSTRVKRSWRPTAKSDAIHTSYYIKDEIRFCCDSERARFGSPSVPCQSLIAACHTLDN